jgi:hypothetical protein
MTGKNWHFLGIMKQFLPLEKSDVLSKPTLHMITLPMPMSCPPMLCTHGTQVSFMRELLGHHAYCRQSTKTGFRSLQSHDN